MEPNARQSIVALQSVAELAAVIAFVTSESGIAALRGELQNIRNIRNRLFGQCFKLFCLFWTCRVRREDIDAIDPLDRP